MPTSARLQLVARGQQDAYLTSNPQFTFFKHVYRRHTPFAMESIPIEFDGNTDFGHRVTVVIPHNADLLTTLNIEVDLPALPQTIGQPVQYWVNDIGYALITDVSVEIGDKEIDKHTGEWLQIWSELTIPAEKRQGFNEMIGHYNVYPPIASLPVRLTIPLRFWFCNTLGAALPLIALQTHPVRIIIHIAPFSNLTWSTNTPTSVDEPLSPSSQTANPVSISRFQMFGDYIHLDKDERQRFAAAEHEYLIDQLQISPIQSIPKGIAKISAPLYFNYCCKEFIWVLQQKRMTIAHEWYNFSTALQYNGGSTDATTDLLDTAIIRLDGYDRFYVRNAPYFRLTQPFQHHTVVPTSPAFIYLYSFSIKPEEQQPSGTLNCSKINDIQLGITCNPAFLTEDRTLSVYATNYNVLRIVGGMGGLAFMA